jgi:hypothetical protein
LSVGVDKPLDKGAKATGVPATHCFLLFLP